MAQKNQTDYQREHFDGNAHPFDVQRGGGVSHKKSSGGGGSDPKPKLYKEMYLVYPHIYNSIISELDLERAEEVQQLNSKGVGEGGTNYIENAIDKNELKEARDSGVSLPKANQLQKFLSKTLKGNNQSKTVLDQSSTLKHSNLINNHTTAVDNNQVNTTHKGENGSMKTPEPSQLKTPRSESASGKDEGHKTPSNSGAIPEEDSMNLGGTPSLFAIPPKSLSHKKESLTSNLKEKYRKKIDNLLQTNNFSEEVPCPLCEKKYKLKGAFKNHIIKNHKFLMTEDSTA